MIKKHWLAVTIVFVACLIWLGIFYICYPQSEPVDGYAPVDFKKRRLAVKKSAPQPPPVNHLAVVLDKNQSTAVKIKSVDLISNDLSDLDQQAVIDFIKKSPNGTGEYVVKNNLMNRLVAQNKPMPGMNAAFIEIASNKNQDTVVRAYAVQHLRPLYERNRDVTIKDFFYKALTEEDTEVSGGAMLALNYLMNQDEYSSDFERAPVIQQAKKIALNDTANNNNRITAIQVASVGKDPELADGLRKIISDPNRHSALRISAIAGLGAIGDESDIAALKVIAQSKNFEKRAARAAIKKISNRRSVIR